MATLGELVVSLSANTAEFTGAMDKAAYVSKQRMEGMVKDAQALGAAIGIGLGSAVAGVSTAIMLAVDRMDKLDEASQKLGVTVEALSGLEYAANLSGVSVETLYASITKLNKAAADGNDAFAAMGVGVNDSAGGLKSADQLISDVAAKFATYKDGAEKSALAMEIFGKNGSEMIPLLNQGVDGIAQLVAEAERMGLVIGKDAAEAAGRFNDALDRIRKTQSGIVDQMTTGLLPVLERGASEFETVSKKVDLVSGPVKAATVLFQILAVVGSDIAFVFKMTGSEIGGIAAQIAALATLDFKGFSNIREAMVEDAAAARSELDAFQQRVMSLGTAVAAAGKDMEKSGSGGGIFAPIVKSAATAKAYVENDLTWVAKTYAAAIEAIDRGQGEAEKSTRDLNAAQAALLDVMSSPAWERMPESWQQLVIAQTAAATSAIEVADQQKRLNDLLAATPTAQLEKQREDMLLLKEAFEQGRISAEEFSEAASTRLGMLPKDAEDNMDRLDIVIGNAFDGLGNALSDFVVNGKGDFSSLVASMIRDLIKLEAQFQLTQAWKGMGGFGGLVSLAIGAFSGGGSAASTVGASSGVDYSFAGYGSGTGLSVPSFDGGGSTGSGSRSGGMDGKGGFLAMLHPDEDVFDRTKGQGGSMSIVVQVDATGSSVSGNAGAANDLGQRIGSAVRSVLLEEKRPGGLLAT